MITKTYTIPNMHCSGCVMALESIEDELPGIERIEGSYKKQTLKIQFNETLVSEADIQAAIRQHGYEIKSGI